LSRFSSQDLIDTLFELYDAAVNIRQYYDKNVDWEKPNGGWSDHIERKDELQLIYNQLLILADYLYNILCNDGDRYKYNNSIEKKIRAKIHKILMYLEAWVPPTIDELLKKYHSFGRNGNDWISNFHNKKNSPHFLPKPKRIPECEIILRYLALNKSDDLTKLFKPYVYVLGEQTYYMHKLTENQYNNSVVIDILKIEEFMASDLKAPIQLRPRELQHTHKIINKYKGVLNVNASVFTSQTYSKLN